MIKTVFTGEGGSLSKDNSSGVDKKRSNSGYILKMTTTGFAERQDAWSKEKRKTRVKFRCRCVQLGE